MSDFIQGLVVGAVMVGSLLILGSLALCWLHRK
jgi:hypothetical protein